MMKLYIKVIFLIKVTSDPIKIPLIHLLLLPLNQPERQNDFQAQEFFPTCQTPSDTAKPSFKVIAWFLMNVFLKDY